MASPPHYLDFVNGFICWTQNIASIAWAIYTPSHTLVHSTNMCIGPATNNQTKYDAIIGLLIVASHYHIPYLCIHLDSQLLVSQLNRTYVIRDPILFHCYLRV